MNLSLEAIFSISHYLHPVRKPLTLDSSHIRGFTLIEMMITVAIIGILASIAIPSYQEYVMRGYLVDATNTLSDLRARLEQHYQDNRTYATVGAFPSPCTGILAAGKFTFACTTGPSPTAYTITATGSAPVNGFSYTIDQSNTQTSTTPTAWGGTNKPCWITRKGGTC